ncbi:Uncharacterised protein [Vibrio cholerae]|nr:Uncharacterised protein [Vibrio cholerae]
MLNNACRVIVSNSAAVNRCIEPVALLVIWATFTLRLTAWEALG